MPLESSKNYSSVKSQREKRRRLSTSVRRSDGISEEGSFFEEELVLGKRSLPSGITYEGSFVNGELAEGTMTIPSLLTFKGVFENGSPKGGILTTANYTADGIFDETGSLVEGNILGSDKTFRTGHFEKCPTVLAGVQLLNGTIVREDGSVSSGSYLEDGSPQKATICHDDGYIETGEFDRDELDRGVIIDEGEVSIGEFARNDEIADTPDSESCLSKGVRVSNDGTVTAFRRQKRKWTVHPDGQYERDINDGSAKLTVLSNSKVLSGETVDGVFTGSVFDALTGTVTKGKFDLANLSQT